MLKHLKTSRLLRYRVNIQAVGLPTGRLAGSASLLDHGARSWDTEYCNTSANSDLGLPSCWFLTIYSEEANKPANLKHPYVPAATNNSIPGLPRPWMD